MGTDGVHRKNGAQNAGKALHVRLSHLQPGANDSIARTEMGYTPVWPSILVVCGRDKRSATLTGCVSRHGSGLSQ